MTSTLLVAVIVLTVIVFCVLVALAVKTQPTLNLYKDEPYFAKKAVILVHNEELKSSKMPRLNELAKENSSEQMLKIVEQYHNEEVVKRGIFTVFLVQESDIKTVNLDKHTLYVPKVDSVERKTMLSNFIDENDYEHDFLIETGIYNILDLEKMLLYLTVNDANSICGNNEYNPFSIKNSKGCLQGKFYLDLKPDKPPPALLLSQMIFRTTPSVKLPENTRLFNRAEVVVAATQTDRVKEIRKICWQNCCKPDISVMSQGEYCGHDNYTVKEVSFAHYKCGVSVVKNTGYVFLKYIVDNFLSLPDVVVFFDTSKPENELVKMLKAPLEETGLVVGGKSKDSLNSHTNMEFAESKRATKYPFQKWFSTYIDSWKDNHHKSLTNSFNLRTTKTLLLQRDITVYKRLMEELNSCGDSDETSKFVLASFATLCGGRPL